MKNFAGNTKGKPADSIRKRSSLQRKNFNQSNRKKGFTITIRKFTIISLEKSKQKNHPTIGKTT